MTRNLTDALFRRFLISASWRSAPT